MNEVPACVIRTAKGYEEQDVPLISIMSAVHGANFFSLKKLIESIKIDIKLLCIQIHAREAETAPVHLVPVRRSVVLIEELGLGKTSGTCLTNLRGVLESATV